MITKPEEHETNRAGKRLLREVLEPLGWVVNDVQEDYGIDSNIQLFDKGSPTGAWFHVQLKSSISSEYSAERAFISQELSVDHARHYTHEMREPVVLIHADVKSRTLYWSAPQLDRQLAALEGRSSGSVTVRIPTDQQLPGSAPVLLLTLEKIYLTLASREVASSSTQSFADSLNHFPDQQVLYRKFQEKNDVLRLKRVGELVDQRKLPDARSRARAITNDPDSTVEIKFWAEMQLRTINYMEHVHAGKPQGELPKLGLSHAKALQALTKAGPKHLRFYSLIAREAAELDVLVHQNYGLFLTLQQHLQNHGSPMMALGLYAQRSALTKRIVFRYNRCLRLSRYAASYSHRWALGRALTDIVNPVGAYIITLNAEKNFEAARNFERSALQVSKLAAWIANETGDDVAVALAALSAMVLAREEDSEAFRWAKQVCESLTDPEIREDTLLRLQRVKKRWSGEEVEGDYQGDLVWQAIHC